MCCGHPHNTPRSLTCPRNHLRKSMGGASLRQSLPNAAGIWLFMPCFNPLLTRARNLIVRLVCTRVGARRSRCIARQHGTRGTPLGSGSAKPRAESGAAPTSSRSGLARCYVLYRSCVICDCLPVSSFRYSILVLLQYSHVSPTTELYRRLITAGYLIKITAVVD